MSAEASAGEADLTPILDMVFQLITFFMLIVNFKGSEFDQTLKLPVLGSAKPVDTNGNEEMLVLNITKDGKLKMQGAIYDFDKVLRKEAKLAQNKARQKNPKFDKANDDLPTTVVVRADKEIPFRLLKHVLDRCQEEGYRKFSLKAMNQG